jgi:hypothetical protein
MISKELHFRTGEAEKTHCGGHLIILVREKKQEKILGVLSN